MLVTPSSNDKEVILNEIEDNEEDLRRYQEKIAALEKQIEEKPAQKQKLDLKIAQQKTGMEHHL